jgi:hypothetical protein
MKERPIIFSAEMVRAIMEDRKTQTRRVVKPQPPPHHWEDHPYHYISLKLLDTDSGYSMRFQHILGDTNSDDPFWVTCPYGKPGDRLWVRETCYKWTGCGRAPSRFSCIGGPQICYADDPEFGVQAQQESVSANSCVVTVPSIHMPRWASRITLEITDIHVERVQSISGPDCWAEGIEYDSEKNGSVVHTFEDLWDSINGEKDGRSWNDNPWVWVVSFKRVSA